MCILSLELGITGGLITTVHSLMLSELEFVCLLG